MQNTSHKKNYIAILAAVFIWSSAIVVTKLALSGLGPLTLSLCRIFVAFLVLLPFARKRGFTLRALLSRNSFIYGIFGYGGNLALLSLGLTACSANISAIIHGLLPVFMTLFGCTMLGELLTKRKVFGIIFAVAGVIVASISGLTADSGTTIFGIVLVALSLLTWGFYSVFSKKTAADMDSFILSEICFGTAFIVLLPFAVIECFAIGFSIPDIGSLGSIVYLGVMSGAVGIILWNFGLKKVDSAIAGIYFNLMPVIGLIFALFAGERITYLQVMGCILVLAGVFIGTKIQRKPSDESINMPV